MSVRTRRPATRNADAGAALDLLDRAAATLLEACRAETTTDRFLGAQLGALRAGAALVAARPSHAVASGVRDIWDVLPRVAPEFGEWAAYFVVCGVRRRDLDAGDVAGPREADDALRAAENFLGLVQGALGLPVTPHLSTLAVAGRS